MFEDGLWLFVGILVFVDILPMDIDGILPTDGGLLPIVSTQQKVYVVVEICSPKKIIRLPSNDCINNVSDYTE